MKLDLAILKQKFHGKPIDSRLRIVAAEIAKSGFRTKEVRLPPECYLLLEESCAYRSNGLAGKADPDGMHLHVFGRDVLVLPMFSGSDVSKFLSEGALGAIDDITEIEGLDTL